MANASHIKNPTQIVEHAAMRIATSYKEDGEENIFTVGTAAEKEIAALKMTSEILENMIETIVLLCLQSQNTAQRWQESDAEFKLRNDISHQILSDIGDEDFEEVVALRALGDKLTVTLKNNPDMLFLKPIISAIRLTVHHLYMMYLDEDTAGVYRTTLRALGYNPQINRSEILNLFF